MPEDELELLQARLAHLEERVARLEAQELRSSAVAQLRSATAEPRDHETTQPESSIDATLIGKSVLIVGGAYVLRALTELGVLANLTGIILALVYSLFWMWAADRAMRRGRPVAALFDAGTAALIAGALIWEATTRFHLLSVSTASLLVVAMSLTLLAIALRQRSAGPALISAVMASVTCIGIAIGTADLGAPMIAATFVGVVISWFSIKSSWPIYVTLLLAGASDSLAVPLIAMTAMDKVPHGIAAVEMSLVAYALLWLVVPLVLRKGDAQTVIATAAGLGGGAIVAAFHGGHPTAIAAACFVISAVAYFVSFLRLDTTLLIVGAIAAAIGSLLVIESYALAMVWAPIAVVSPAIGRRLSWKAMPVHGACWAVAAFATAVRSPVLLLVVCAAAGGALWMTSGEVASRSRLALLSVVTASLIVAAVSWTSLDQRPLPALNRTAILAIVAVILSMISRHVPEATTIARIVLVVAGLKLVVEDLRLGQATTIVVALVLYGGAIVIVARRRAQSDVSL